MKKQQEQDRLFSMTMKLNNPNTSSDGSTTYHVYNITSNLQKFISNPQNETGQYNLNQTNVFTYPDQPVFIWIQGSIIGKDKVSVNLYVKVSYTIRICRMEEKIHCNICDTDIDTSNLTEQHLSTSVHGFHKSNLEKILLIIRTVELYKPADSVISYWKKK